MLSVLNLEVVASNSKIFDVNDNLEGNCTENGRRMDSCSTIVTITNIASGQRVEVIKNWDQLHGEDSKGRASSNYPN